MDILTERGQETLEDERRAVQLLNSRFPDLKYIETDKGTPARVDAILLRDSQVYGVVETKCRYNMTLEYFQTVYKSEWLVTYDKIAEGKSVAVAMHVPLIGMLYIKDSDVLLVQRLCEPNGLLTVPMRLESTVTQATVNGGEALRTNAYIKLAAPTIIAPEPSPA